MKAPEVVVAPGDGPGEALGGPDAEEVPDHRAALDGRHAPQRDGELCDRNRSRGGEFQN